MRRTRRKFHAGVGCLSPSLNVALNNSDNTTCMINKRIVKDVGISGREKGTVKNVGISGREKRTIKDVGISGRGVI
jgi:hypothetical protein